MINLFYLQHLFYKSTSFIIKLEEISSILMKEFRISSNEFIKLFLDAYLAGMIDMNLLFEVKSP